MALRGKSYGVRFAGPDGKRVEKTTGTSIKSDAYLAAAKIVLREYQPSLPPDPKTTTWNEALDALPPDMRERTLTTYRSTVHNLREELPDTKGPNDITPELAKRFRVNYGKGTFSKSDKSDAKSYKRSAKTVENQIRRLSGLWGHLKEAGIVTANPWQSVPRPTVPKKSVSIPTETLVDEFMGWLDARYPDWPFFKLFVTTKALAGCRTSDLCHVKSRQLRDGCLVIEADQDKTHRERTIPLPPALFAQLDGIKGKTHLWESYSAGAKVHRRGKRNLSTFKPITLYWAVADIFRDFNEARPGLPRLTPHAFRRRAITRMVMATQSIDQTAAAIQIDPSTARRYYLDHKAAFDGAELMKKMAGVLWPGQGGVIGEG